MKALVLILLLMASFVQAAGASLAEHPFWKCYLGEWTAKGDLKAKDGKVVTISQRWKGSAEGEHGFCIKGERTIDNVDEPFRWQITQNNEAYEALLTGKDEGQPMRFEGNVSEVLLTLELKGIMGSGSSCVTVTERFMTEKRDMLESKIVFTNEQGEVTLEGVVIHQKG
jgi:hypothetical protein